MNIFRRRIPIVPGDLAALVGAAGVGGPAEARFAKEYPAINAVAAFNAEIPSSATTLWEEVLREISRNASGSNSALGTFVIASLTANRGRLRELDRKLFTEAALSQGVKAEEIETCYAAALRAAADPGIAVVRKHMESAKQDKRKDRTEIKVRNVRPTARVVRAFQKALARSKIQKESPVTARFFLEGVTRGQRGLVESIDYTEANIVVIFGEKRVCWRAENFIETYLQLPTIYRLFQRLGFLE